MTVASPAPSSRERSKGSRAARASSRPWNSVKPSVEWAPRVRARARSRAGPRDRRVVERGLLGHPAVLVRDRGQRCARAPHGRRHSPDRPRSQRRTARARRARKPRRRSGRRARDRAGRRRRPPGRAVPPATGGGPMNPLPGSAASSAHARDEGARDRRPRSRSGRRRCRCMRAVEGLGPAAEARGAVDQVGGDAQELPERRTLPSSRNATPSLSAMRHRVVLCASRNCRDDACAMTRRRRCAPAWRAVPPRARRKSSPGSGRRSGSRTAAPRRCRAGAPPAACPSPMPTPARLQS